MTQKEIKRCGWVSEEPLYIAYHDTEWGVPVHNDAKLFEFLVLEGMQAGLSWLTILRKRENFRKALDQFDYHKIANYGKREVSELLNNGGIIRNRLKIASVIQNAKAFLEAQKEYGSFDNYIWKFVDNKPLQHNFRSIAEIPARIEISDVLSKDLKKRGFKFVGSTICYAHMQATGMVNDHTIDCFRYRELFRE